MTAPVDIVVTTEFSTLCPKTAVSGEGGAVKL